MPDVPDPYDFLPDVPSFTVTSQDIAEGARLADLHASAFFEVDGGEDVSPQLSWSGFPQETKSFAVTVYDPNAPTGSGFWHWAAYDIPVSTTSLPRGAGAKDGGAMPAAAVMLSNDAGYRGYVGAAPPAGHGTHHYYVVVHALDVESLGLPDGSTPGFLGFNMFFHTLARGRLVAAYSID
ncbi:MAG: YbhB/YbcL family Raf kinase inhibitor-like protein [Mycobacteriales bacterium]